MAAVARRQVKYEGKIIGRVEQRATRFSWKWPLRAHHSRDRRAVSDGIANKQARRYRRFIELFVARPTTSSIVLLSGILCVEGWLRTIISALLTAERNMGTKSFAYY